MEYLLLGTSIQGIPPFRGHKIWSWKNVSQLIFISVTFTEGTPLFRGKGHFFCNRRQNCCRMISENKRIHTPLPPLHSKLACSLFSTGSRNSGTTLHGEDGGGQALVGKTFRQSVSANFVVDCGSQNPGLTSIQMIPWHSKHDWQQRGLIDYTAYLT